MTTQRKYEILGAVLTILLAACFLRAWVEEREFRIRAEVTSSAAEQTVAAKNADIAARDVANGKLTDALQAKAAAIVTPQQAARVIVSYLPAPIATPIPVVSRADLPSTIVADLPADPSPTASVGIVTDKQLVQIGKDEVAGDACRHDLLTCQADALDLRAVVAAKQVEVNTWQTAAKGGTKLQRLGKVLKFTACAGAGAGLASFLKVGPTGAAVGAGAGVLSCAAFTK